MKSKLILGACLILVVAVIAMIRTEFVLLRTVSSPEQAPIPSLPAATDIEAPWTLEADSTSVPSDDGTPKPLDIKKLRAAVRSGDSIRVDEVAGESAYGDEEDLFMLICEVPGDVSSLERKLITRKLMRLLRTIPGERSSRFLHLAVRKDGFIPQNEWIRAVNELGERGHPETFTYLETVAFSPVDLAKCPEAGTRAYLAAEWLIKQNARRYLPAIVQRVRDSTGSIFSGYLGALAHAPASSHPEIGKLVPLLRDRYRNLPPESHDRYVILDIVSDYAVSSRSEEWRCWALSEVTNWKFTQQDEDLRELTELLHQVLLARLERADR